MPADPAKRAGFDWFFITVYVAVLLSVAIALLYDAPHAPAAVECKPAPATKVFDL